MKKFTFLLAFIFIALLASSQNKNELQFKLQRANEKISKITQRSALLSKRIELLSLSSEFNLKSAATKQKLDSIVWRELDLETQLWQNSSKDEFSYNSEMKNTSWLSKEWDVSVKAWYVWSKTELAYNNQGRVSSMLMYISLETGQVPTLNSKFVNYYNSQGIIDSTLVYSTEDAGVHWILDLKQINHYNALKQLTKLDVWALDDNSGKFTLEMNMVYTYTASGKIKTSSSNYITDGEEMLWTKTEYNYDTNGKLISFEDWDLSMMTFVLEKSYRTAYQYNASGDVSVAIYSEWNGTAWDETEKDENIYSTTSFSEVIFPSFYMLYGINETIDFINNKQITGMNSFKMMDGSWKNTDKAVYYYSGGTSTNITELSNTAFTVYPNPASEKVNFSWKGNFENLSLEMYQNTGAKVLEQITYSGKPVSISKLEDGVYFFRLLNDGQIIYNGKLIKK